MGFYFLTKTHRRVQGIYRFALKYLMRVTRIYGYLREGYTGIKVIFRDYNSGDMKRRIIRAESYSRNSYFGITKKDWKHIDKLKKAKLAQIEVNREQLNKQSKVNKRYETFSLWHKVYWNIFMDVYKESPSWHADTAKK